VGGVERQHVNAGVDKLRGALQKVAGGPMAAPTRRRPFSSLLALGYLSFFWMSLTVMSPLSSYWSFTTRSFSTRCSWRMSSASSRVVRRDCDEVLLGHHVADGDVNAGFEAQVTVGEDADELFALGDGTPEIL